MARNRILAIIQAGGSGGRMDVLTRERAKPALPFAGVYELVDFPLSNLTHSGIDDVWLSVQFQGSSIEEPVANGRPWDLDRSSGGLRLLMPQQGTGSDDEEGFARGNADELFRVRDRIRSAEPEVVIVLSADHVYRFDFLDAVDSAGPQPGPWADQGAVLAALGWHRGDERYYWAGPGPGTRFMAGTSWLPSGWNQPYLDGRIADNCYNGSASSYVGRPTVPDPFAIHFMGMNPAARELHMARVAASLSASDHGVVDISG